VPVWKGVCLSGRACACLEGCVPVWKGVCLSSVWVGCVPLVYGMRDAFCTCFTNK